VSYLRADHLLSLVERGQNLSLMAHLDFREVHNWVNGLDLEEMMVDDL
jgi:hypothetical protein